MNMEAPPRYAAVLGSFGVHQDPAESFDALMTRYSQPHRRYHDLRHIQTCLEILDRFFSSAPNSNAIELALWYHDAIYDPTSKTNELDSAELLAAHLGPAGMSRADLEFVQALILSTAHSRPPASPEEEVVRDIDMSILGASPAAFDAYSLAVRQEYSVYDDLEYAAGRSAFLKSLLAQPRIYLTRELFSIFEAQARLNLSNELETLKTK